MTFLFSPFIVGNIVRSWPIFTFNISVVKDVGVVGVGRLMVFSSHRRANNPLTSTINKITGGRQINHLGLGVETSAIFHFQRHVVVI